MRVGAGGVIITIKARVSTPHRLINDLRTSLPGPTLSSAILVIVSRPPYPPLGCHCLTPVYQSGLVIASFSFRLPLPEASIASGLSRQAREAFAARRLAALRAQGVGVLGQGGGSVPHTQVDIQGGRPPLPLPPPRIPPPQPPMVLGGEGLLGAGVTPQVAPGGGHPTSAGTE